MQTLKQCLIEDRLTTKKSTPTASSISDGPYLVLFPEYPRASGSLVSNMPVPQLWRVYLRDVHPFFKLINVPACHQTISHASKRFQSLSASDAALLTAVIYLSVNSLTDEVCKTMMQEDKPALLVRCRQETERALARAKLLATESLKVLQAFVAYLV